MLALPELAALLRFWKHTNAQPLQKLVEISVKEARLQ